MRTFPADTPVEEATAALLAEGLGDGLPVVPPTGQRLDHMLDYLADPDAVVGSVPPLFGDLTARNCAWCCVLAGCNPGALPVVLAAARACLAPEFNLLGVQTTTGTAAVAVVVHGPVVERLGLTRGPGLLGPGPHANGVIGRALALTLALTGGVQPGVTTMATTAQPGRYTFCLAEAADAPYPSPAASAGIAPEEDAVTVLAISGTTEVLPRDDRSDPDDALDPLASALAAAGLAAGNPARMAACEQAVVLPPEVAVRLAPHRPQLDALQEELFGRATHRLGAPVSADAAAIHPIVAGGPGIKMLHLPGWIGGSRSVTHRIDV